MNMHFTRLFILAACLLCTACCNNGAEVELIEYRGRVLTTDTARSSLVFPEFTPSEDIRPVPVEGAVVRVKCADGEGCFVETRSDAQGYFTFRLPRTKEDVVMTITHDNYQVATEHFVSGPFSPYKASTTILTKKPKL